jgi:16S rRNA (cytosine1402-N4)-methyltransferase
MARLCFLPPRIFVVAIHKPQSTANPFKLVRFDPNCKAIVFQMFADANILTPAGWKHEESRPIEAHAPPCGNPNPEVLRDQLPQLLRVSASPRFKFCLRLKELRGIDPHPPLRDTNRMELPATGHDAVLLAEVLDALNPVPGKTIVDCTLGRGGHASAILPLLGKDGLLIGLDADPRNLEFARQRLATAAPESSHRLFHANFSELPEVLHLTGTPKVDGILADLGLSTNQLFDPQYGLSFQQPMPLDMRIDPRTRQTAADLVNRMSEEDLANVLYNFADERYSRRIARKIGEARRQSPIKTTDRLAQLVRDAIPRKPGPPERIDPATRTFMALRMAVNDEMGNLQRLLEQVPKFLSPGGRLAIISFHSVEDRLVKQAFRSAEQTGSILVITKRPLSPEPEELARNPRSRSAKLRVVERS